VDQEILRPRFAVLNFSSFVRLIAAAGKVPFCTAPFESAQSGEPPFRQAGAISPVRLCNSSNKGGRAPRPYDLLGRRLAAGRTFRPLHRPIRTEGKMRLPSRILQITRLTLRLPVMSDARRSRDCANPLCRMLLNRQGCLVNAN